VFSVRFELNLTQTAEYTLVLRAVVQWLRRLFAGFSPWKPGFDPRPRLNNAKALTLKV
jgi:hypothetical protein